ncbi:MAG: hypothetical protein FWG85_03815 [Bacteroidetes bacterium]|nr:hypothetical protein [Bacteroidota bacterium]
MLAKCVVGYLTDINVYQPILNCFAIYVNKIFNTGLAPCFFYNDRKPPRHLLQQMPPLHRSGTVPLYGGAGVVN